MFHGCFKTQRYLKLVSYNVRAQDHDGIVLVNDLTVLPPAIVSGVNIWTVSGSKFAGSVDGSGFNVTGPLSTTKTNTAATSGPYAPLGYVTIQVSGNAVKVPFFTV